MWRNIVKGSEWPKGIHFGSYITNLNIFRYFSIIVFIPFTDTYRDSSSKAQLFYVGARWIEGTGWEFATEWSH